MKNKLVVINYDKKKGEPRKKAARNYLVIPQSKRVYLIMSKELDKDTIFEMCDEIISTETRPYMVYIYVRRESNLFDLLKERYGELTQIQPVIIGKKTEMYINAADIILTKTTLLREPYDEVNPSRVAQMIQKVGTNIKELIADVKKSLDIIDS